ncbi:MAG: hypothetical protein ACYCSN_18435 [Acidobacteriaceae bacterium]
METAISHRSSPARVRIAIPLATAFAALLCCALATAQPAPSASQAMQAAQPRAQAGQTVAMLPAHITLPIVLAHTIDSRHAVVGQPVVGKLAQHVQIGPKAWLPKGAIVQGRILAVNAAQSATGPSVTFEFDRVAAKNSVWRTKTSLLALASLMEVYEANEPATDFDDRANQNEHAWTVRQIGGDIVYRDSDRIDDSHGQRVGTEDAQGQYSLPGVNPDGSPQLPRALGLFSTTAHGVYGMPGYTLANEKKTGAIAISAGAENKNLRLHYGVALLLETEP